MVELYRPVNGHVGGAGSSNSRKSDGKARPDKEESTVNSGRAATTLPNTADSSTWLVDREYLARLAILYGPAGREESVKAVSENTAKSAAGTGATVSDSASGNLDKATAIAQQQLAVAAQDKDTWHEIMRQSYGASYDYQQAEQLRQQTLAGDFSWMPEVQVVDAETLNPGGNGGLHGGAYSEDTDTIYISAELLDANPELAAEVLLEEIGHAIDARVNESDTKGDEGEIFGRLVSGETLSESELAAIRAEDDSGTITIGGVRVDVEYSGDVIDDIFDGISDFFDSVTDMISDVWEAIKDLVMEVIMSDWFGWILTILSFIPILQLVVLIIQIVRAVYMVYQGIKHGSIAMVLGGIASVATGLAKVGTLVGASAGAVNTLNNVAQYAKTAAATYKAISEEDFGAALSIISSQYADTDLAPVLDAAARGYAVYQAADRGDVLGAIGLGANLLESIPGDNGDEILATISTYAGTIDQVVTAVENGDYSAAAGLLNSSIGEDLGLSEETRAHFQNAADSFEKLAAAKSALESGDYSGAAEHLFDIAGNYAPDEKTATAFRETGEMVARIAEVVELVEAGKYSEALATLNEIHDGDIDNPALASLVADVERWASGLDRIHDATEQDDYIEAAEILLELAEIDADAGTRALFANLEVAGEFAWALKAAIDAGDWSAAYKELRKLIALVTDPALSAQLAQLAEKLRNRADDTVSGVIPGYTEAA